MNQLQPPSKVHFFLTDAHKQVLAYIRERQSLGKSTNILVTGPQGSGKSTLPAQYAAVNGRPYCVLEIGLLNESSQIFGRTILAEGKTSYQPGLLVKAIQTPGTVIHLQELNRPENDRTLNAIFSILDDQQRGIWVDEADQFFAVAPGVVFFASLNQGYDFVGTMPLDIALLDRFSVRLQMSYLPPPIEANLLLLRCGLNGQLATQIVGMANQLRNNSQKPLQVSTRALIAIAEMVKYGLPTRSAFQTALNDPTNRGLEQILAAIHFSGQTVGGFNGEKYGLYI